jgi:hypothetical protein
MLYRQTLQSADESQHQIDLRVQRSQYVTDIAKLFTIQKSLIGKMSDWIRLLFR